MVELTEVPAGTQHASASGLARHSQQRPNPPSRKATRQTSQCTRRAQTTPSRQPPAALFVPELFSIILEHTQPDGPMFESRRGNYSFEVAAAYLESRSAFAALCRVCKSFYGQATAHLYRSVLVRDSQALLNFFWALAGNPNLRPLVRSFCLYDSSSMFCFYRGTMESYEESLQAASRRWVEVQWPSTPSDAILAEAMGINEPKDLDGASRVLGSALAMMSKLESLFLRIRETVPTVDAYSPAVRDALWHLVKSGPGVYLRELSTAIVVTPRPLWTHEALHSIMVPLLVNSPSLSSVQTLAHMNLFAMSNDMRSQYPYWNWYNPAPRELELKARYEQVVRNIRHLNLYRGVLDRASALHIADTFPNLESLALRYCAVEHDSQNFETHSCFMPLQNLSECLKYLCFEPSAFHSNSATPLVVPLMNRMRVLEDVRVNTNSLFGPRPLHEFSEDDRYSGIYQVTRSLRWQRGKIKDVLPASVIRFTFNDEGDMSQSMPLPFEEYYNVFTDLYQECPVRFPNLCEVVLELKHRDVWGVRERERFFALMGNFEQSFAEVGVTFTVKLSCLRFDSYK